MIGLPQRGEVWWSEVPDYPPRPVVVLSRDAAIRKLQRALVAPCSTVVRNLATEVHLEPGEDPVWLPCVVQLDSALRVSVVNLTSRLGRLSDERIHRVCRAMATAMDCR